MKNNQNYCPLSTYNNSFPMWHKLQDLKDGSFSISMANDKEPENGTVYSINTLSGVLFFKQLEVIEQREHRGKFNPDIKALFYSVKCQPGSYDVKTGIFEP